MKSLLVLFGLVLSFSAHASQNGAIRRLLAELGREQLKPMRNAGEPLLRIHGGAATQGAEYNVFINSVDYQDSITVVDAALDGAPTPLDHPSKSLWIFNSPGFEKLVTHTLAFTVSLESASQAKQLSQALGALQKQIQDLQKEIADTTDQNQLNQLNALLSEKTALQAQLTADLANLKKAIGTQNYSFTVNAAPAGATFPRITGVTPNIGPTTGGTAISITGANFVAGTTLSIGGVAAGNVNFVSSTSLTAVTPAFSADGPQAVVATLPLAAGDTEQKQALLANAFFATSATSISNTPYAVAGASQAVALGSAATLDGSHSVGPSQQNLAYAWSLISKPAGSNLPTGTTVATTATASVTPDFPGNYVYQLVVTDTIGNVASAPSLTIVTANLASAALSASAPSISVGAGGSGTSQIAISDTNAPYLSFSYYITQPPVYGSAYVSKTGLVTYSETASSPQAADSVGVTVVDSNQESYTLSVPVAIQLSSTAPVINVTPNVDWVRYSNGLPAMVNFWVDSISTPNGSIATIAFDFGDGSPIEYVQNPFPNGGPITASGGGVNHFYGTNGTYLVTATVTDNLGVSTSYSQNMVFQDNLLPVGKFTITPSTTTPLTVTVDASASTSPGGHALLNYLWQWGDGTQMSTSLPTATHTYAAAGTYTGAFMLTDSVSGQTYYNIQITVGANPASASALPVSSPYATGTASKNVNVPYTFDGATYSYDPNPGGSIASFSWQFNDWNACPNDGCTSTSATPTHAYSTPGNAGASLVVTNSNGVQSQPQWVQVYNVIGGVSPQSFFTVSGASGPSPYQITADGSASYAPSASIASYDWNWGDGTPDSAGPTATHVYTANGVYFLNLTITDSIGNVNSNSMQIRVNSSRAMIAMNSPSGGDNDYLVNGCAHKDGMACYYLSKKAASQGDTFTATALKTRACTLGYAPACSGRGE